MHTLRFKFGTNLTKYDKNYSHTLIDSNLEGHLKSNKTKIDTNPLVYYRK